MSTAAIIEDDSFTDACRTKLKQVKSLSEKKCSYECNVIDRLEVLSAVRRDNNKNGGEIVMRYQRVSKHHLNNQGSIHGGALATWVDVVTSLSIWFISGVSTVSVGLSVDYIGAASDQSDLYFYTSVDKVGKTLSFATCQIATAEGKIIANASHTVTRARL